MYITVLLHTLTYANRKFWIRNRPGDGLITQLQRAADEEAEQMELADGAPSAPPAGLLGPKRAKAGGGGARGSLAELVTRLAFVLPMASSLPQMRAHLSEQQQQQSSAADSASAGAEDYGGTAVKRAKLTPPTLPGLDLISSGALPECIRIVRRRRVCK